MLGQTRQIVIQIACVQTPFPFSDFSWGVGGGGLSFRILFRDKGAESLQVQH